MALFDSAAGPMASKQIAIGNDIYQDDYGDDAWVHSTKDSSTSDSGDIFGSLVAQDFAPVDPTTPPKPILPGVGCVLVFAPPATPGVPATTAGMLDLSEVNTVIIRLDPSRRVSAMALVFSPTSEVGKMFSDGIVLTFDYASPVTIMAPDPAKVVEQETPRPSG